MLKHLDENFVNSDVEGPLRQARENASNKRERSSCYSTTLGVQETGNIERERWTNICHSA